MFRALALHLRDWADEMSAFKLLTVANLRYQLG